MHLDNLFVLEILRQAPEKSQNLRVTATSSNPSLIQNPFITTLPELSADSRLLSFAPQANQYGVATITVTVEDAGLDGDLGNIDDNGVFSQTFDVTVTPDSSSPIVPTITIRG